MIMCKKAKCSPSLKQQQEQLQMEKNCSIIRTSVQSLLKYGWQVAYDLSLTLGFNIPPNSSLTGVIRKAKPHVRAMFMTSMGAHLIKQTKRVKLV